MAALLEVDELRFEIDDDVCAAKDVGELRCEQLKWNYGLTHWRRRLEWTWKSRHIWGRF